MTTRRAGPPTRITTSWNVTGHLKVLAGNLNNNRLICRELTGARSEGVRLASQATLLACAPCGRPGRPVRIAQRGPALDVACGSGLAIKLARLRGASCSGVDASASLVAVARDPACDIRIGDMHALPWDPASFDVVTSFRGIWGTTPDAVARYIESFVPAGAPG
jgi:SAM-dependent methyltransferase